MTSDARNSSQVKRSCANRHKGRSPRRSAATLQGRYFTFITSGCLIRTRGDRRYCQQRRCLHVSSHLARRRENPVFAPAPPSHTRPTAPWTWEMCCSSTSSRPTVKAKFNTHLRHAAGRDQHLRLFTTYSKNIQASHTPATFLCLPTHRGPRQCLTSTFFFFLDMDCCHFC